MTLHPQQQEYIITEEMIQEAIDNCKHPSIASIWKTELRSRPHKPAPCKQSYSECPIRINEAATRNAERNATLDDAIKAMNKQFNLILKGYQNPILEVEYVEKNIFEISKKEAIKVIQSLRTPTQERI
jgi:hypothetical protein